MMPEESWEGVELGLIHFAGHYAKAVEGDAESRECRVASQEGGNVQGGAGYESDGDERAQVTRRAQMGSRRKLNVTWAGASAPGGGRAHGIRRQDRSQQPPRARDERRADRIVPWPLFTATFCSRADESRLLFIQRFVWEWDRLRCKPLTGDLGPARTYSARWWEYPLAARNPIYWLMWLFLILPLKLSAGGRSASAHVIGIHRQWR